MYRTIFDEMLDLEKTFNGFYNNMFSNRKRVNYPAVNVYETEEDMTLVAVLPGVKPENVDLVYEKGILTISGHKKPDNEEKNTFVREERSFGEFSKSLTIGQNINVNTLSATYKDGLLYINMKKEEKAKPKRITING